MSYGILEYLVVVVFGVAMCSMLTVLYITYKKLENTIKEDLQDKDDKEAQWAWTVLKGVKIFLISMFTFLLLQGFIK